METAAETTSSVVFGTALIKLIDRRYDSTCWVNPTLLEKDMVQAVYRFWVSERRMPAAIVIPRQLAQKLQFESRPLIGEVCEHGVFHFSEIDRIPVLSREAYIDPLFTLI